MVGKRGKTTTKVNSLSLKAKSLAAKEAKGVKGGTFTYKPAGTINWGDSTASKVQGKH